MVNDAWIAFVKLTDLMSDNWAKRHEDRWRIHLQKKLGNILARDITRAHLASALDAMTRKGIKEETRKALTTLNLVLDYGLTRQYIEQNSARTLKPKDFAATASKPRDRALTILELRKLWLALDQVSVVEDGNASTTGMSIITTSAIKLLILTGARRLEVAAMRRSELDLNNGVWTLPPERTKNRLGHTIYLSLGIQLIEDLHPISGNSPFVFDTGGYRVTPKVKKSGR